MLFAESICRGAEQICFSQISYLSLGSMNFSSSSWIGAANRIQVLFISVDGVEFLHRETFTAPAYQEPEAAGEYEELEEAVEDGNLRSMLIFPTGVQMVGTFPYPMAVQGEINNHAQYCGQKAGCANPWIDNMGNPVPGHMACEE